MSPGKAPASSSQAPAVAAPSVPLATKVAGAPSTTTQTKPDTPRPSSSPVPRKEFGDLYFQPTRESGESEEDYRRKLDNINREVVKVSTRQKMSPGSFTLLTERKEKGYTGETRFNKEIQLLEKEQERLRQELQRLESLRRDDPSNKDIYTELIQRKIEEGRNIDDDIDTLLTAGGEHYMKAKQDATFASSPRRMKGDGLRFALERTQHLTTGEAVRKIGSEIKDRNTREIRELQKTLDERAVQVQELKEITQEQAIQIQKLKDRIVDLVYGMKKLSEGTIPDHIQETLLRIELTLKALKKAHETGEAFDPSENGDLDKMLETVDELLSGNLLGKEIEEEIKQEAKTPAEALQELMNEGIDITIDALKQKGVEEKTAEATIALLKREGVIT